MIDNNNNYNFKKELNIFTINVNKLEYRQKRHQINKVIVYFIFNR